MRFSSQILQHHLQQSVLAIFIVEKHLGLWQNRLTSIIYSCVKGNLFSAIECLLIDPSLTLSTEIVGAGCRSSRDQLGPKFRLFLDVYWVFDSTISTSTIVAFTNLGWNASSDFYRFPFVYRAPSKWSWQVEGVKTFHEEKGHPLTTATTSHIVAIWLLCQQKGQLPVISWGYLQWICHRCIFYKLRKRKLAVTITIENMAKYLRVVPNDLMWWLKTKSEWRYTENQ